jgi:hypothetical protein
VCIAGFDVEAVRVLVLSNSGAHRLVDMSRTISSGHHILASQEAYVDRDITYCNPDSSMRSTRDMRSVIRAATTIQRTVQNAVSTKRWTLDP